MSELFNQLKSGNPKKPKPKKEIHLTEARDVAIFKDLIDKLAHLTPATRDRNPGIGPGMLNTLIDYAQKLEKAAL